MAMRLNIPCAGELDVASAFVIPLHIGTTGAVQLARLEVFVRDPRNKDPRTAFDEQTGEHGYWEAVPVVR